MAAMESAFVAVSPVPVASAGRASPGASGGRSAGATVAGVAVAETGHGFDVQRGHQTWLD